MQTQEDFRQKLESAVEELKEELKEFNTDALNLLAEDLENGKVVRGSWAGCVISYKQGAPGSVRRDRFGRVRNDFTIMWDAGWLSEADVHAHVVAEINSRMIALEPVAEVIG